MAGAASSGAAPVWSVSVYAFGGGEKPEDCRCGATALNHVTACRVDTETGEVFRRYAAMCDACAEAARVRTIPPPPPPPQQEV